MPAERLQKLLARAGYGSRRHAETLIVEGHVQVNGEVATLGTRVDPNLSTITVNGQVLQLPSDSAYKVLALNKPVGYVVSAADDRGRPTIYDLLAEAPPNLRYVGRLDVDTSGLLLLTTDGELVHRLTHPRYEVWKTYEAAVRGIPIDDSLNQLRTGVPLKDGPTAPARVELLRRGPHSLLRLELREGRKREVRRMLAAVGHPVTTLKRTAVGTVVLGALPEGESRHLSESEQASLRALVGLPPA